MYFHLFFRNEPSELWSKKTLIPFAISMTLMIFQQWSGVNTVIFNTVTIFTAARHSIYIRTLKIGQYSTLGCWVDGRRLIEQASDVPSIIFFIISKAELLQLNRTQFPSLGIFVSKKVGNRKN
jgi:hypothetical protein